MLLAIAMRMTDEVVKGDSSKMLRPHCPDHCSASLEDVLSLWIGMLPRRDVSSRKYLFAARKPDTVKNSFGSLRVFITFVPHNLRVERHMFAEVPPVTARPRDRCDLSGCDGCIADAAVG